MASSKGYIIVGGGIASTVLASTVLASRLAQHASSARVLVLEAGPDVSHRKDILYFQSFYFIGGEFDWNYKRVPQQACNNREIDIAFGCALGGGSVVNGCRAFFSIAFHTTREYTV
ncbi:hypothetical protein GGR57DRAFT_11938 [Xylariaceae sp. FL1272]|nr:hypothetical protein GGR57DRAFT_11938 [Xylariaceae sp. FL1272]